VLRFHHSAGARLSNPLLDQQRLGDVLDGAGNELRGAIARRSPRLMGLTA
jgi:hypothetical protein